MNIKLLVSIGVASVILSGCIAAPILVGGAAVTTASVATDRRTAGSIVSDEVIEKRVGYDISQALGKTPNHITVTSYEGLVLLTGEVGTEEAKQDAEKIAKQNRDVKSVINALAVMEPTSVSTRLSDSLIATKVRTSIIGTSNISLNQMKVTVDRGVVYLMGIVTEQEAQLAAKTASEVSGVLKVVKCFNVESQEEVNRRVQSVDTNKNNN